MTADEAQSRKKDSEILAKRAAQVQRGGARAAVLGVNDGLVSILALILGVAAAGGDQKAVIIAAFAAIIAGAFSMAAGEWISVKSQVDLFDGVLNDLKRMIKTDKALLQENLAKHYVSDGYDNKTAIAATNEVSKNQDKFFQAYSEQVVGLNPDELGSPWVAAVSSFVLFVTGALAPMMPWFFVSGTTAIIISIVLTGIGGLLTGGYVAYSSGKSLIYGALRQFLIILVVSAFTYGVGKLFGHVV